jgi:hypothetical protein
MPMFVALVAACAFYLYAWAREVPLAAEFLTAAVAALAVVDAESVTLGELTAPHVGPLLGAVLLQAWVWMWRREWWRAALGAAVAVAWGGAAAWRLYLWLREQIAGLDYLVLSLVLLPVAVSISLVKGGALARWRDQRNRTPTPTG